jgi:hypothetical protein
LKTQVLASLWLMGGGTEQLREGARVQPASASREGSFGWFVVDRDRRN